MTTDHTERHNGDARLLSSGWAANHSNSKDFVHKEVSAGHDNDGPHEQLQQPSTAHRCDVLRFARLLDKRLTSLSSLLDASRARWASRSATSTSRLDMLALSIHCSTARSLSLRLQSCLKEETASHGALWSTCTQAHINEGKLQERAVEGGRGLMDIALQGMISSWRKLHRSVSENLAQTS